MPGFVPNEAEKLIADIIFKRDLTDRIADLELGLFTNASADETLTHATVTEPTGTGYARKNLTDASWTGTADVRSYALQQFVAGAGGWTGAVRGYFVCTKGATKRLVAVEVDSAGPYTMNANDTYDVTLNVTVA